MRKLLFRGSICSINNYNAVSNLERPSYCPIFSHCRRALRQCETSFAFRGEAKLRSTTTTTTISLSSEARPVENPPSYKRSVIAIRQLHLNVRNEVTNPRRSRVRSTAERSDALLLLLAKPKSRTLCFCALFLKRATKNYVE